MFQFALEAVLFRLTYDAPSLAPLFELPPRWATRTPRRREAKPCVLFDYYIIAVQDPGDHQLVVFYIHMLRELVDRELVKLHQAVNYVLLFIYKLDAELRGKGPPLIRFAHDSPSQAASGLQDKAAPMFQRALEAVLLRLTHDAPSSAPLSEVPPRRATRTPLLLYQQPSQ